MDRAPLEHSTFREWLFLEPDGELTAGERSSLRQHVSTCRECQRERLEVKALDRLLEASRIPVGGDLRRKVMGELPAAGWEARLHRSWLLALAVVLLLGATSALLIGASSAQASAAAPLAALAGIWELFRSSALAGAGLLGASWKGLGLAFQEVLGQSVWNIIALGVVVFCLDLLLLRYLLRRRAVDLEGDRQQPIKRRR